MNDTGSWTITRKQSSRPGSDREWTEVSHPGGARFTVEHRGSTAPASADATGADSRVFPWSLSAAGGSIYGHGIGNFATHDDAVDAVVHRDWGLLLQDALDGAWIDGASHVGMDLAMEMCPVHGFGLLEYDSAWTWNPQSPTSLGLTDVDEMWVLVAAGRYAYAVVQRTGDGELPWRVWSVGGSPGAWDFVDEGLRFASRHAAVARVESYRDDLLDHRSPSPLTASEECCLCEEEPYTLE